MLSILFAVIVVTFYAHSLEPPWLKCKSCLENFYCLSYSTWCIGFGLVWRALVERKSLNAFLSPNDKTITGMRIFKAVIHFAFTDLLPRATSFSLFFMTHANLCIVVPCRSHF